MIYDPEYLAGDWEKEHQVLDLLAEIEPARTPPHYFKEDTKEDFLREIEAENVRASNEQINYHE